MRNNQKENQTQKDTYDDSMLTQNDPKETENRLEIAVQDTTPLLCRCLGSGGPMGYRSSPDRLSLNNQLSPH